MAGLSEEQIAEAAKNWLHSPHIRFLDNFLIRRGMAKYFDELKSHAVVEIGPGNNQVTEYVACKEYTAAKGSFPNDGLSVLRKMPDNSAVVVSFGVFDDSTLNPFEKGINLRYAEELAEEVKRVMMPFSIIIGSEAKKYLGKPDIFYEWDRFGGVYFRKPIICEAAR